MKRLKQTNPTIEDESWKKFTEQVMEIAEQDDDWQDNPYKVRASDDGEQYD